MTYAATTAGQMGRWQVDLRSCPQREHFLVRLPAAPLVAAGRPAAEAEKEREVPFDTSTRLSSSCPNDGWRFRARWWL
jgi:hypothetical protein